jgi:D-alanine-D-alanine ligase-like ATP-grasp enzyme
MKEIAITTLLSARKQLTTNSTKLGFELMGFDFMLDADFNTWLIEVNTNP